MANITTNAKHSYKRSSKVEVQRQELLNTFAAHVMFISDLPNMVSLHYVKLQYERARKSIYVPLQPSRNTNTLLP